MTALALPRPSPLRLIETIAGFLASLEVDPDVAPATRKTYGSALRRFGRWLSGRRGEALSPLDIESYKGSLLVSMARSSANVHLSAVRAMFRWAEVHGEHADVARNIRLRSRTARDLPHRWDRLTAEEIKKLSGILPALSVRDRLIVLLKIVGGLRDVEIERAGSEDIRFIDGHLCLQIRGKGFAGEVSRIVVLDAHPLLMSLWNEWRTVAKADGSIFDLSADRIGRIVASALSTAGIDREGIVGHSLRHTAASLAIEAGASLEEVRQFLGHADVRTSQRYVHDKNRLARPVEAMIQIGEK